MIRKKTTQLLLYMWIVIVAFPTALHCETDTPNPTITIRIPNLPDQSKPLEMVLIQAGSFTMGAPKDEAGRHEWEWPLHPVTIRHDFYIGRYEITQAQWAALMGNHPANGYGEGPDYPVYYVTWNDCQEFILKLNEIKQGTFRLPTEAEWEYACRAGTTTRYSYGDASDCGDVCELCATHDRYMWWCGNNRPTGAKEVGLKEPNPWGLFDMHGNIYEWCLDWWQDPYPRTEIVDPQGPAEGTFRVLRGGGWSYDAAGCRSAFRYGYAPDSRRSYGGFGFRVVKELF